MRTSLLIYCLLAAPLAFGQPVSKLYAFSQAFTPGMVPQRDIAEEKSDAVQKPNTITQYYVYIKLAGTYLVQPRQVWTKGQWHKVVSSPNVKTPVYSADPNKELLVPATKYKVQQVQFGEAEAFSGKLPASAKKMMEDSELILAYTWRGKLYFCSLKKIQALQPIHGL